MSATTPRLRRMAASLVLAAVALLALVRFQEGLDDAVDAPFTATAAAVAAGILVAGAVLAVLSARPRR